MSLTTENGTIVANAESYCDVSTALAYHTDRNNVAWLSATTAQQETALRKATDYMTQTYSQSWQGLRVNNMQVLDWPRVGVTANGYYVLATTVPVAVQRACAELALRSLSAPLLNDLPRKKQRTKIDVIEIEYDPYSDEQTRYAAVDAMLAPYLCGTSSVVHKLTR